MGAPKPNITEVRNAAKTFPKAAFFTFGMNDIGNYRGNATAFIKKYRETIADFSSKSPHTKLFVNSISVPSNPAREKNRSLNQYKKFNSSIRQMCAKQIRNHANVRHSTKQGRKQLMRILEEDTIGTCSIENVKMSDAKEWALRMKEKGYSFITISNHKRSLKAAFYSARRDDGLAALRPGDTDLRVHARGCYRPRRCS